MREVDEEAAREERKEGSTGAGRVSGVVIVGLVGIYQITEELGVSS